MTTNERLKLLKSISKEIKIGVIVTEPVIDGIRPMAHSDQHLDATDRGTVRLYSVRSVSTDESEQDIWSVLASQVDAFAFWSGVSVLCIPERDRFRGCSVILPMDDVLVWFFALFMAMSETVLKKRLFYFIISYLFRTFTTTY